VIASFAARLVPRNCAALEAVWYDAFVVERLAARFSWLNAS
jgi:hypothetical protein